MFTPDDLDIVNDLTEVKLSEAKQFDENAQEGDWVYVEATRIDLGHIAIQNSKGLIINKAVTRFMKKIFLIYSFRI